MNRAPTLFGLGSTILNWIGGTLTACGAMWLLLLVREYHLSVFTIDATPNSEAAFWTDETLAGVIISAVVIAVGGVFLLLGCTRLSVLGRDRHHRRRHHGKSTATVPPIGSKPVAAAPITNDDEEVSFDTNEAHGENLLSPDTPGAPPPHGKVRVRVKRRIKVRIRKPNE